MKKSAILILLLIFLTNCSPVSRFGTGVDITFDPRTIGMQIDDTIMQKNLSARLALADKKYFLSIQSEVLDGRIFLSGKVDEPEEKLKITKNKSKKLTLKVSKRDLSEWDVKKSKWEIAKGDYIIHVGTSVKDISITEEIKI